MFTGLVQAMGTIVAWEPRGGAVRLRVDLGSWDHRPGAGSSISVDGCCLTVVEAGEGQISFDAVQETLAKTTLGDRRVGSRVNLEHAVRADALLGGHIVQGHVDGVGRITRVQSVPGDWRIEVCPPEGLMEYMTPKGSVAIDGVSLTLASVGADSFGIALIPETLERTTLGALVAGARVNIEADPVAKTVVHWLRVHGRRG